MPRPDRTSRSQQALKRRRGVTLLECVVSIAIIGTSVVAGYSLLGLQSEVYASERGAWKAMRFLSRELEHVYGAEFDLLETTDWEEVEEDNAYRMRRVVSESSGTTKEVQIELVWSPNGTVKRSETVTTLRARGTQ